MLLSNLLIMDSKIPVSDALLYALIGFILVFVGIGILIGVLYLVGFIMQKTGGKAPQIFKREKKAEEGEKEDNAASASSASADSVASATTAEEVPDEVKAAIVAAIMAYYNAEKPKCEFVIRKIKRI